MVNKYFSFFLAGILMVSCVNVENKDKSTKGKNEHLVLYAHVNVAFPSDSMGLEEYTDTVVITTDNGIVSPFYLVGLIGDSLNSFSEKDIKFSKKLNGGITQIYFGDYLRQYMVYSHDKYGLLYVARTDWEKDDFILLSHYKYSDVLWKSTLAKCIQIHKKRKTPTVQE